MFKELITELTRDHPWVSIQPPCGEAALLQAQEVVGFPFPPELNALLRELDGDQWCILSAKEIVENVQRNREIFLPMFLESFSREAYEQRVNRFIFFASNGCGDYYGYRVSQDQIVDDSTIYIWEHEDLGESCCWKPVASGMVDFLTKYYHSEI